MADDAPPANAMRGLLEQIAGNLGLVEFEWAEPRHAFVDPGRGDEGALILTADGWRPLRRTPGTPMGDDRA